MEFFFTCTKCAFAGYTVYKHAQFIRSSLQWGIWLYSMTAASPPSKKKKKRRQSSSSTITKLISSNGNSSSATTENDDFVIITKVPSTKVVSPLQLEENANMNCSLDTDTK